MLELGYDYSTCVRNSERVSWTLDEVFPPTAALDFGRPFLPPALSGEHAIAGLSDAERIKLNQITGNAYLNLFGFVEEHIIAMTIQHAEAELHGDKSVMRALLRFADEEVKHQQLFQRFAAAFVAGFGTRCGVIDNAIAVAGMIMSKSPIAVMIVTLHLEIMTQAHYTESVRHDASVDPLFASLLEKHWLEESQHARIDALELDRMLDLASPAQIHAAMQDYLDLVDALDELLGAQATMDLDSLQRACGRTYAGELAATIIAAQHKAYRNTFLVMGMQNRMFVDVLRKIDVHDAERVAAKAASLS